MNRFVFHMIGNKPVGFTTYRYSKDTAYVFELHVEEKYRSLGLGSKLLSECTGMCPDIVAKVVLYVYKENLRGLEFYRKNGFEVNEEYSDGKFHEMVFRR